MSVRHIAQHGQHLDRLTRTRVRPTGMGHEVAHTHEGATNQRGSPSCADFHVFDAASTLRSRRRGDPGVGSLIEKGQRDSHPILKAQRCPARALRVPLRLSGRRGGYGRRPTVSRQRPRYSDAVQTQRAGAPQGPQSQPIPPAEPKSQSPRQSQPELSRDRPRAGGTHYRAGRNYEDAIRLASPLPDSPPGVRRRLVVRRMTAAASSADWRARSGRTLV